MNPLWGRACKETQPVLPHDMGVGGSGQGSTGSLVLVNEMDSEDIPLPERPDFEGEMLHCPALGQWLAPRVGHPLLVPGPEGEKQLALEEDEAWVDVAGRQVKGWRQSRRGGWGEWAMKWQDSVCVTFPSDPSNARNIYKNHWRLGVTGCLVKVRKGCMRWRLCQFLGNTNSVTTRLDWHSVVTLRLGEHGGCMHVSFRYTIMTWDLHTVWNDHCKSSNRMPPYVATSNLMNNLSCCIRLSYCSFFISKDLLETFLACVGIRYLCVFWTPQLLPYGRYEMASGCCFPPSFWLLGNSKKKMLFVSKNSLGYYTIYFVHWHSMFFAFTFIHLCSFMSYFFILFYIHCCKCPQILF